MNPYCLETMNNLQSRLTNLGGNLTNNAFARAFPPLPYFEGLFWLPCASHMLHALIMVLSSVHYFTSLSHWSSSMPIGQVHWPSFVNKCFNGGHSPFKNWLTLSSNPLIDSCLLTYSYWASICWRRSAMWLGCWSLTWTINTSNTRGVIDLIVPSHNFLP